MYCYDIHAKPYNSYHCMRMLGNPKKVKDQGFLFLCIKLHIPIFFPCHFLNKKKNREKKASVGT